MNDRSGHARSSNPPLRRNRLRARLAIVVASLLLAISASAPAWADEYESDKAGHPLRIIAYVVHPVGVIVDYLLLRPAHWIASQEPFKTVFGHED